MEGYLKIFVLKELKDNSMSGYELMQDFELSTGAGKPSCGTIYPLLNDLLEKGFLKVSEKSNKKIYSLSKKGEVVLAKLMHEQKKSVERTIKMFGLICNPSEIKKMRKLLGMMSRKKEILANDMDVINIFRSAVMEFAGSKEYSSRRKEFRNIVKHASKEIMGLR